MSAACTNCRGYVTFVRWPPCARCQRAHALTKSREDAACLTKSENGRQETPASPIRGWARCNPSPAGSGSCTCRSLPLVPNEAKGEEGRAGPCC